MRPSIYSIILVSALALAVCREVPAEELEFLEIKPGVYQNSCVKVVGSQGNAPGIMVVLLYECEEIQVWDPRNTKEEGALSFFIGYDPKQDSYDYVQIGDRRLAVSGGFTLNVETSNPARTLRVVYDFTNPYLTIFYSVKNDAALLGFGGGLSRVVNVAGNEAEHKIALLEAFSLSELSKQVKPYQLSKEGLLFEGKPFPGNSIGVALTPKESGNPCLGPSIYLDSSEYGDLEDTEKRKAALQKLSGVLARAPSTDRFKGALLLRNTKEFAIFLKPGPSPAKPIVEIVRPIREEEPPVCLVQRV
ncbi:MAG: hypothetical protein DCC75_07540 [Proteobacteria bacterium]|nr:MAG: hypothetical protein DCC75_07540 [Pseudomonadota bacterium]